MGILDQLAGQVLSGLSNAAGEGGQGAGLLQAAVDFIQQQEGGLTGLVQKFQNAGLGDQVASWIGTGENQPIDASQLLSALGEGPIGDLVGKLGLSTEQVASGMAELLPVLIDKLTPNGSTEGASDLLSQGLSLVASLFGNKTSA